MAAYGRDPNALGVLKKFMGQSNVANIPTTLLPDAQGLGDIGPSDAEVGDLQAQEGEKMLKDTHGAYGYTPSAESVRGSAMQELHRKLSLNSLAHRQEMEKVTQPEIIRGQYGVKEAETTARAGADRLAAQENSMMERLQYAQGQQNQRQQVGIDAKPQVNPGALGAIAREREAIAARVAKTAPGAVGRFFGRANPGQGELDTFDNTLSYAQKIAKDYPELAAEEALGQMGVSPDSNELGQIQKFLLLLRGH